MSARKRGGPLQGVRVIELTKVWAGPYVGKLMTYLGAEVIRIESLESLDVTRIYGVEDMNNAPGFQSVNAEKLSAQINMKTAEGIELILDLITKADIVVENLRPGAIKRLGLGYETVKKAKPDVIYVSMGMYGNEGPLSYQTGYAPCFAALGGISELVGYDGGVPAGINLRYADSTFGTVATYAALVALMHHRRSGTGQFIDVSAVETITSMIGDTVMSYTLNGEITHCAGNKHPEMAPHGLYPCRNGEWICIAVPTENAWRTLTEFMGQPELGRDEQFRFLADRKQNEDALNSIIARWTSGWDATELAGELQAVGIAGTKSLSSLDLVADSHLWSRGFYTEVTDKLGRSKLTTGPSWKMSRTATISKGAPLLGEDNDYVFGDLLGMTSEQQQELCEKGILR